MVVCMKTGEILVDLVFKQSLINDSSANTASTEEAYEERLAALR